MREENQDFEEISDNDLDVMFPSLLESVLILLRRRYPNILLLAVGSSERSEAEEETPEELFHWSGDLLPLLARLPMVQMRLSAEALPHDILGMLVGQLFEGKEKISGSEKSLTECSEEQEPDPRNSTYDPELSGEAQSLDEVRQSLTDEEIQAIEGALLKEQGNSAQD